MIITYKFDTEKEGDIEERQTFDQARDMSLALWDIQNFLREIVKYPERLASIKESDDPEGGYFCCADGDVDDISDEVADKIRDIISEYKLDL